MRHIAFVAAVVALAAAGAAPADSQTPRTKAQQRAAATAAETEYRAVTGRAQEAFGAGDFGRALQLSSQARDLAAARLGRDHPLYFQSLNDIAVVHQILGNEEAALPMALLAAGGLERVSGADDRETLNALSNLAQLYVRLDRSDEAEPLLRRVYATRERVLGLPHQATLNALLELAVFLSRRSRLAEIQPLLERGEAVARTALGPDSSSARDLGEALAASRRAAVTPASVPVTGS
jgi:hypothetical protein